MATRDTLFKDSPEIQEARREIKERIEDDLEEVAMRYGRVTVVHALGKVKNDFTRRRFVNPYAISDEDYEHLLKLTNSSTVVAGDRDPDDVANDFVTQYHGMEPEAKADVERVARQHGEAAIFAWVDLVLSDVWVEERDRYAERVTERLLEEVRT